jgi:hypothetical protein
MSRDVGQAARGLQNVAVLVDPEGRSDMRRVLVAVGGAADSMAALADIAVKAHKAGEAISALGTVAAIGSGAGVMLAAVSLFASKSSGGGDQLQAAIASLRKDIRELREAMEASFARLERHTATIDTKVTILLDHAGHKDLRSFQNCRTRASLQDALGEPAQLEAFLAKDGNGKSIGACFEFLHTEAIKYASFQLPTVYDLRWVFVADARSSLTSGLQRAYDDVSVFLSETYAEGLLRIVDTGLAGDPHRVAASLAQPALNLEQLDQRLRSLQQSNSSTRDFKALSDWLTVTDRLEKGVGSVSFRTYLEAPVNTEAIIKTLDLLPSLAKLWQVTMTLDGSDGLVVRSVNGLLSPEDKIGQRRAGNAAELLQWFAVLGYRALAQEAMLSGDVLLPVIDELLKAERSVDQCPVEALPDGTLKTTPPGTKSPSELCSKYGKQRLEEMIAAVHDSLRGGEMRRLRDNLVLYRLKRMGDVPYAAYAYALASPYSTGIEKLYPGLKPMSLRAGDAMHWHVPLSGKCDGLDDEVQVSERICVSGICRPPRTVISKEIKPQEERQEKRRVCLTGRMPRPEVLKEGLLDVGNVELLAAVFSSTLDYIAMWKTETATVSPAQSWAGATHLGNQ